MIKYEDCSSSEEVLEYLNNPKIKVLFIERGSYGYRGVYYTIKKNKKGAPLR